jgi:integrase/recombinase XerD
MRIREMGEKAEKAHIQAITDFAAFLKRSPDTAVPEDLRTYQLHMTNAGITPTTFNARIVALPFVFGMTCGGDVAVHAVPHPAAEAADGLQH